MGSPLIFPVGYQCNDWTVISTKTITRRKKRLYRCRCKCGEETWILAYRLRPESTGAVTRCRRCADAKRLIDYAPELTREYLIEEYETKRGTLASLARETGYSVETIRDRLVNHGIRIQDDSDSPARGLTGKTFGKWSVGPEKRKPKGAGTGIYYTCTCECGTVRDVFAYHLLSGRSQNCKRCSRSKDNSPHWKGHGQLTGYHWGKIVRDAAKRDISVVISISDAWELFLAQKERCALTGMKLKMPGGNGAESDCNASLDRIDSQKGYEPGNVQWVHKHVNRMKNEYDEPYFLSLCSMILKHHARRRRRCG